MGTTKIKVERQEEGAKILNIILPDHNERVNSFFNLIESCEGDVVRVIYSNRWDPWRTANDLWEKFLETDHYYYEVVRIFAFGCGDQVARELYAKCHLRLDEKLEIYTVAPIYDKRCLQRIGLGARRKIRLWKRRRGQHRYYIRDYAKVAILPKDGGYSSSWTMLDLFSCTFLFEPEEQRGRRDSRILFMKSGRYLAKLNKAGAFQRHMVFINLKEEW